MKRIATIHCQVCRSRLDTARSGGFTYLWVMLTVAIVGLGLATADELYSTSLRRDKERELLFIGQQFRSAIRQYAVAHGQQYPDSLQSLLLDPNFPGVRHYLRRIYVDPMTGKPDWGLVQLGGRIVGVHSMSHNTPLKVDNFEPPEAGFKDKEHYAQWTFTYPANLVVPDDGSPIQGLQTTSLAAMSASGVQGASGTSGTSSAFGSPATMTMPASNATVGGSSWEIFP